MLNLRMEQKHRQAMSILSLIGDGIKLVNINQSNVMFDLTGSGFANKTGYSFGPPQWDLKTNGEAREYLNKSFMRYLSEMNLEIGIKHPHCLSNQSYLQSQNL